MKQTNTQNNEKLKVDTDKMGILETKKSFVSFEDKLFFLMEEDYIDETILNNHPIAEIEQLYLRAKEEKFEFKTKASMRYFYEECALRTRDTNEILEDIEDRAVWTALYLAEGDSIDALRSVRGILRRTLIPAPNVFKYAGKKDELHRIGNLGQKTLERTLFKTD